MKPKQIFEIIYILSLLLFLIGFLIQKEVIFTYQDPYGILFKLNGFFWLGYLTLLILVYYHFSNFDKIDEKYVYFILLLVSIYLIGTPLFYEHLPRFEDTWGHSFLAQEIFKNERVRNNISGYENYPGSFLFYGTLFKMLSPYFLMKFLPPIIFFSGIITIYLLFQELFDKKISFLASIFYMFFNWTVEDNHISPQFLMLYLYFLFMFITIRILKSNINRKQYLGLIILFSFVIVFSHPLTPIFLLLIFSSIFLFCQKCRDTILLVGAILVTTFVTYNIIQTSLFVSLAEFLNNFLEILIYGTSASQVSQRISTDVFSRQVFVWSRIGITLFSIFLGLIGAVILHKKLYKIKSNFLIAWTFSMTVFALLVGVVLRGEFFERFVLISSLPLAALSVYTFSNLKKPQFLILIILFIISPFFFIAKYGNEAIESISLQKLNADCFSYYFYTNCEERQDIVDSPLAIRMEYLGIPLRISREDKMAISLYSGLTIKEVENLISNYTLENKTDKIYSNNFASFYI